MSDSEKAPIPEKPTGHGKFKVVENVAFADALEKAHVNPWSKRMIQMYGLCLLATLNSCINGYDGSLMSSINAMDSYQREFNMIETGAATGFVFAIYSKSVLFLSSSFFILTCELAIGNICGSFVAGPLTDTWGRRWGMFAGGWLIPQGSA